MILDWPGCGNARDVGGLATSGGGRIPPGVLIRSDNPPAAAAAAIRGAGIVRVLDLRGAAECERTPSPFAGDAVYRQVPVLEDVLSYVPPADSYVPMIDHNRERIGRAFRELAAAPDGAVLVHCRGGRDRTGVLVALALRVAGVEPALIAADYALTAGADPAAMLTTLAHVDARYGGAGAYLRAPAAVGAVRRRLGRSPAG